MPTRQLTADEQSRVDEILDQVMGAARVELRHLAEMLVSKPNSEFFGETEFFLREGVHRIGARLIDAALEERKKRGTKGPASAARNVRKT